MTDTMTDEATDKANINYQSDTESGSDGDSPFSLLIEGHDPYTVFLDVLSREDAGDTFFMQCHLRVYATSVEGAIKVACRNAMVNIAKLNLASLEINPLTDLAVVPTIAVRGHPDVVFPFEDDGEDDDGEDDGEDDDGDGGDEDLPFARPTKSEDVDYHTGLTKSGMYAPEFDEMFQYAFTGTLGASSKK
jgi:hypothetical protein